MTPRRPFLTPRVVATAVVLATTALASAVPATRASEVTHPAVVSTDAVDWTPHLVAVPGQPKPVALSVAEAGDRMLVGGRFTAVEDGSRRTQVARSNLVAFSASTGAIDAGFAPQVDGDVWAVTAAGSAVFIGGNFTTINGTTRPARAKLDLVTGALDADFRPPVTGGRVTDLEVSGGRLYVAGTFGKRLVALDPSTGARRSEEHTSELQSRQYLVCRLLL